MVYGLLSLNVGRKGISSLSYLFLELKTFKNRSEFLMKKISDLNKDTFIVKYNILY